MNHDRVLMKVQSGVCDAELHPELIGMKAGPKRHWIRHHFPEFEKYHAVYGPYRTMQRYGIKRRSTLDAMLASSPIKKLQQSERALLNSEIALESSKATNSRVNELEARIDDIEPMARVGYAILEAMKKALPGIEFHPVKRPDRLRLERVTGIGNHVMSSDDVE